MPKAKAATADLTFTLSLPHGGNTTALMVMGGADADHDGTVEDNGEYATFTRNNNIWTLKQTVPEPVKGMVFYVQANVGPDVAFDFDIEDGAGVSRFSKSGVTVNPVLTIRWVMS